MTKARFILFILVLLLFEVQARAVEYRLPDLEGRIVSMDQYRGKWLIVNYWATWCGTCLKELPELIAMHEYNGNRDVAVVGINFESISNDRLM